MSGGRWKSWRLEINRCMSPTPAWYRPTCASFNWFSGKTSKTGHDPALTRNDAAAEARRGDTANLGSGVTVRSGASVALSDYGP